MKRIRLDRVHAWRALERWLSGGGRGRQYVLAAVLLGVLLAASVLSIVLPFI